MVSLSLLGSTEATGGKVDGSDVKMFDIQA